MKINNLIELNVYGNRAHYRALIVLECYGQPVISMN
jgi:hypothetical protein